MELFGNQRAQTLRNSAASASVDERMAFLKKVYSLLALSLLTAVVGAYVGRLFVSPALFLPLVIGELVMVFVVMGVRHKPGWNIATLFMFTGLTGITLAPVMTIYDAGVIQEALVLTVLIFGGLTMYVMASKRDFSFLGGFLFAGLLVVIVGSLLNAFWFQSPAGEFVIAAGGVLLFSGFILYDTSNIIRRYSVDDYTAATLALYLDILNLFLFLLRLLGGNRS